MSGLLHNRHQNVGPAKLLLLGALGFAAGAMLGYIFMGTVHAMLQIKAEKHYGFDNFSDDVQVGNSRALAESTKSVEGSIQAKKTPGVWYPTTGDEIHTLVTSNGSPYLNFQNRIMYATYKMVQKSPGGEKLVAFTRILHRTKPDVLMISGEVPTFRADPLTPACDNWCEFPVSDRPNAVAQFLRAAEANPSLIKAPWLLMIETDYVWHKPLAAPGPAEDASVLSLGFPFGYITPQSWGLDSVIRKMYPVERGPTKNIPNTGPAPILMRVDQWIKVVPDWERLTAHIEADKESKDRLGWVREMYAFSIAIALADIKLDLKLPPNSLLITQPPADDKLGQAAMTHYTWGALINDASGKRVWEFDKRTYTAPEIETKTPKIPMPPPFADGWKLLDGHHVDRKLYDMMVLEVTQMNKGIDTLPDLTGVTA